MVVNATMILNIVSKDEVKKDLVEIAKVVQITIVHYVT